MKHRREAEGLAQLLMLWRSPLAFILFFLFLDGLSQALSAFVFFFSFFFKLDSEL